MKTGDSFAFANQLIKELREKKLIKITGEITKPSSNPNITMISEHAYYSSKGFVVVDEKGILLTCGYLDKNAKMMYEELIKYV